jgi:hypothetical protein
MTTMTDPALFCSITDSCLETETVSLSGRWGYRITKFTRTAVANPGAKSGWFLTPGVHYCAETHLLRDGQHYGAMPKTIREANPEARDAAVAKRIEGARKRKAATN